MVNAIKKRRISFATFKVKSHFFYIFFLQVIYEPKTDSLSDHCFNFHFDFEQIQ